MTQYFNINYEFDVPTILRGIDEHVRQGKGADYICVADGVILSNANRKPEYLQVINGGVFTICDSSYVPLYLRWIYGKRFDQYCGAEILMDIIRKRKYRMLFMGSSQKVLDGLRRTLVKIDPAIAGMTFYELPYCKVDDFDYPAIARMVTDSGADIIWVSLGAPKQEMFMSRLKPHLQRGVMIAVGAAFKFYSDAKESRAPEWMRKRHMEFVYRLLRDPKKQFRRCFFIVLTLPGILLQEYKKMRAQRGRQ